MISREEIDKTKSEIKIDKFYKITSPGYSEYVVLIRYVSNVKTAIGLGSVEGLIQSGYVFEEIEDGSDKEMVPIFPKRLEYKIISAVYLETLESKLNIYTEAGWEVSGSVVFSPIENRLFQVMIREKNKDDE